ncbi:MAG: hypothetical protein B6226_03330 [Candidatus Cloacimonetes bacterium 4572_65]|nr:MAG: hypothetical protein B6226_03330 [Candidatus Cloacimonetes bacterium 4572_65]
MKCEKVLRNSPILKSEIIPTPRVISVECGFSILLEVEEISSVVSFFKEEELKYSKMFLKEGDSYEEY